MKLLTVLLGIMPLFAAQEPAKPEPVAQDAASSEKKEAAPAKDPGDRTFTGSVDLGYRFNTGIAGNFNAYRTTVNLGEGPKLMGFDLKLQPSSRKYFDRLSAFGLGWGGDPYTTARLDIGKERVYDIHLDYKNVAYFNYLPTFANPALDRGILATERGYDLRRRMFDADIRFRPGTRIIPYLLFSRNTGEGNGVTTFVGGGNEYPIATSASDATTRVSGGVNFEFNKFHATFEEGSTTFHDYDNSQNNQTNLGNRTTPFAGQTLSLATLSQLYRVKGDGYFTKLLASYNPLSWIDISGQVLYSKPNTTATYLQNATGNFVDLSSLNFYTAQTAGLAATANQPHSAGSLYLEIRPIERVRILESYSGDHLSIPSMSALTQTTSISTPLYPTLAYTRLETTYNRHQTEGLVDIFRWLTLRAGFRNVWGDLTTRAPQVNGVDLESAQLKQNVVLAGAQMRLGQKLRASFDVERGTSYKSYFRTSLHDYEKGTARVRYQAFANLGFNGSFTALYNENPTPGVNYDFKSRQASAGFFWNPNGAKRYSVLGDYTFSSLKSNLGYFAPQLGSSELSDYRDNAHTGTLLFDCSSPGGKYAPHMSLGGSMFKSWGSRPSTYMQPVARLSMPLHEHANFFTEWRYYGLGESYYTYEGFRSHVFTMGLRLLR